MIRELVPSSRYKLDLRRLSWRSVEVHTEHEHPMTGIP